MKKFTLTCLLLVSLGFSSHVFGQSITSNKLSLQTQMLLQEKAQHGRSALYRTSPSRVSAIQQNGVDLINGFITVSNQSDIEELRQHGVKVQTVVGTMLTTRMPVDSLVSISNIRGVKHVSISQKCMPCNDQARAAARVDLIQAGEGLPQAYTGKGVIVGIIDCSIDFNHINFKDAAGKSRVKCAFINDSLYTTPEAIAALTDDAVKGAGGHGSHTTGIAAGSYTANGLQGMAPESDLILCGGNLENSHIINCLAYIFQYADSVGKPAVVNMSLGDLYGPHDGKDEFTQMINQLTGEGKLVVIAASNNGDDYIRLHKECTQTDESIPQVKTLLQRTFFFNKNGNYDLWNSNESPVAVKVVAMDQHDSIVFSSPLFKCENGIGIIYSSSSSYNQEFAKYFQNSEISLSPTVESYNDRFHMNMNLNLSPANDTLRAGLWLYTSKGSVIDVWGGDRAAFVFNNDGLEDYTKGLPSFNNIICGKNTISVGSYNTRVEFTTLNNETYNYTSWIGNLGDISRFSSYGTDFNGMTYPHVTAPGAVVFSSINRYDKSCILPSAQVDLQTVDGEKYIWGDMQGTSMACPVVSGAIALWLQADPTLTCDRVKEILKNTSVNDEFTKAAPEKWGYGKLDAYAGLNDLLTATDVDDALALKNPTQVVGNADQSFDIYMQTQQEAVSLKVYSMNGTCLYTGKVAMNHGKGSIDLKGTVSAGLYLMRLEAGDRESYTTKVCVL